MSKEQLAELSHLHRMHMNLLESKDYDPSKNEDRWFYDMLEWHLNNKTKH